MRDFFEAWVFDVLGQRMRIDVEQIKVLSRYTFLVVVSKLEDQRAILLEPYLHMGSRMVIAMPWTPDFDANAMRSTKAPVWIDLPLLNRAFEYYANQMLAKVGTVLYAQIANARSKFSHIRGCVLCNVNEDLIEYIDMSIRGVGTYRVDVIYRTLPDACFACKKRGHIARYCPAKSKKSRDDNKNANNKSHEADPEQGANHKATDQEGNNNVTTLEIVDNGIKLLNAVFQRNA